MLLSLISPQIISSHQFENGDLPQPGGWHLSSVIRLPYVVLGSFAVDSVDNSEKIQKVKEEEMAV